MPKSKYDAIYKDLKQKIESNEFACQQLLPSENSLIQMYDCSRNTVRRAVSRLVTDGYVQTMQGKGVRNIYRYLEHSLHMTIVNSRRVMTVEKITQIDEKYLELNSEEYNCMAVVTSYTYNSDGVMFEFTQSRHRPDYFRFQDNAVRRP